MEVYVGILVVAFVYVATVYTATTPVTTHVIFDIDHKAAFVVTADGCYDYHLEEYDVGLYENATTRGLEISRILAELQEAEEAAGGFLPEIHETHAEEFSQEVKEACGALPMYFLPDNHDGGHEHR